MDIVSAVVIRAAVARTRYKIPPAPLFQRGDPRILGDLANRDIPPFEKGGLGGIFILGTMPFSPARYHLSQTPSSFHYHVQNLSLFHLFQQQEVMILID